VEWEAGSSSFKGTQIRRVDIFVTCSHLIGGAGNMTDGKAKVWMERLLADGSLAR
jgi:hypothetical protein